MKRARVLIFSTVLFVAALIACSANLNGTISRHSDALRFYNNDVRNNCLSAISAAASDETIVVLGSSELSSSDGIAFPPVLFNNGSCSFSMVFIGRGYTQSLHHAINVAALSEELPSKKVVLVVSPQWFTEQHLTPEIYSSRFLEQPFIKMLENRSLSLETKTRLFERVYPLLAADPQQQKSAEKFGKIYIDRELDPFLFSEMSVYSSFMEVKSRYDLCTMMNDDPPRLRQREELTDIDFDALMDRAETAGAAECTNNPYYITDVYYDKYIKEGEAGYSGYYADRSFCSSPEYDDFRLFLTVCKELDIKPLIVIVPVNGWWYDYTGFPKADREQYYRNIREICAEYGVETADFSDKEYEPYFLRDIMHLGWKGWVYFDEAVYKFYKEQ